MKVKEIIKYLHNYQKWRRGADLPMPNPKELGIAIDGAIRDEVGAYDGGEYALALDGELYADGEEENTYHKAIGNEVLPISDECDNDDNPRLIRAEWCPDDQPALSWRISSNIPYASFTIKEDGEPYCEGIIIDIDDIIPNNK